MLWMMFNIFDVGHDCLVIKFQNTIKCNQYIFSNSKMIVSRFVLMKILCFPYLCNCLPFQAFSAKIILKLQIQSSKAQNSRKYPSLFQFSIIVIKLVSRRRKLIFFSVDLRRKVSASLTRSRKFFFVMDHVIPNNFILFFS